MLIDREVWCYIDVAAFILLAALLLLLALLPSLLAWSWLLITARCRSACNEGHGVKLWYTFGRRAPPLFGSFFFFFLHDGFFLR
jgi:hypothetical protein